MKKFCTTLALPRPSPYAYGTRIPLARGGDECPERVRAGAGRDGYTLAQTVGIELLDPVVGREARAAVVGHPFHLRSRLRGQFQGFRISPGSATGATGRPC